MPKISILFYSVMPKFSKYDAIEQTDKSFASYLFAWAYFF